MKYYERVTVSFDRDLKNALDEVVDARKTNRSQLFRSLFNDYYKSYKTELMNCE